MPPDMDDARAIARNRHKPAGSELRLRVMSGAAMAVAAVLLDGLRRRPVCAVLAGAGALIFWEWFNLVARRDQRAPGSRRVWCMPAPLRLSGRCCARTPTTAWSRLFFLFAVVWTTDIAGLFRRAVCRRAEAVAGGQPEEDLVRGASADWPAR